MRNNKIILLLLVFTISLICLSTISANSTNIEKQQNDNLEIEPVNHEVNMNTNDKIDVAKKNEKPSNIAQTTYNKKKTIKEVDNVKSTNKSTTTNKKDDINENSSCCSVIVQVSKNESVLSFRRDSSYQAKISIENTTWFGSKVVKQSKTKNGYFVHSIITEDGWTMGFGGYDKVTIQANIVKTAGNIYSKKTITNQDMNKIYQLVKSLSLGHAVIKSPDGTVGVAIYNNGGKYFITKLLNGEYVCVPNSIRYYHTGKYSTYSKDPVNASIKIAGYDRYGVNRRNIMTYHITPAKLNIYVTNDDGRYVSKASSSLKDPLVCLGKNISTNQIPSIPNKRLMGTVYYEKVIPTKYSIKLNGTNDDNLQTVIQNINKYGKNDTTYTLNLEKGTYYFDGIKNKTITLNNNSVKNIKININGNGSTLDGKNTTQILSIEKNYMVNVTWLSFINSNNSAIYNKGKLNLTTCTFKNNTGKNGEALYNTGLFNITNSVILANNIAIYSNGNTCRINNNWWGMNNPNWDKILKNVKKPDTYIIMKFSNYTTYNNSKISFKISLNRLNNNKVVKNLACSEAYINSEDHKYSKKIIINNEIIFTYHGNPKKITAKIDNQTFVYTMNLIKLKISNSNLKIGYDNTIKILVQDKYGKNVTTGTIIANINNKTSKLSVENGISTLNYKPLTNKTANITLSYIENKKYPKTEYNNNIPVVKTNTYIKANITNLLSNNTATLKLNVYDEDNNLIKYNTKVSIKINGITQLSSVRLNNATEYFNINIPKKAGKYNITIISGENSIYNYSKLTFEYYKVQI